MNMTNINTKAVFDTNKLQCAMLIIHVLRLVTAISNYLFKMIHFWSWFHASTRSLLHHAHLYT